MHGYHEQTAADVPVDGRRVVVRVRVRRMRCPGAVASGTGRRGFPAYRAAGSPQDPLARCIEAACPEISALASHIRDFAALLVPDPGNAGRLQEWIIAARAADLPHLHAFTRGLDRDLQAAAAALTMPFHNGRTEGVNTKTKMIKRQMYGRAGFALLLRILLGLRNERHHRK